MLNLAALDLTLRLMEATDPESEAFTEDFAHLEHIPSFNMCTWGEAQGCGTAACIAGFVVAANAPELYLEITANGKHDRYGGMATVAHTILGGTEQDQLTVVDLFLPWHKLLDKITREEGIAAVRRLRDGKAPWPIR